MERALDSYGPPTILQDSYSTLKANEERERCSCQGGIEHNLSSYTHTFMPPTPPLPTYNQSGFRTTIQDPYQKTRNKMEKLGRSAASSSPRRAPCLLTASVSASISALPSGGPSGLGCSVPRVHNPGHSGNLLQFLYQTQHFCIDTLPPKSIFHH